MRRLTYYYLCLFLSVLICSFAHAKEDSVTIDLKINSVRQSGGEVALQFKLINTGRRPLKLFKSYLPWGILDSIILVAVTNDASVTRIDEALYIDDPGPETITIAPSKEVTGTVDLVKRFPNLLKMLHDHSVIVFWSYQTTSVDGGQSNRVSNSILLSPMPKK
jgi:hypothetical protein